MRGARLLATALLAVVGVLGGPVLGAPDAVAADPAGTGPVRDLYLQPFAWDSPWNLPLSTQARYVPFDSGVGEVYLDIEDISVDPSFPVRTLDADGREVKVHTDPELTADGSWNHCSTFLVDDGTRQNVIQGQPLKLDAGGDPSYEHGWPEVSLTSDGLPGCHGGSGLSGLGGSVRVGEVSGEAPIRHALKISLNCKRSCSTADRGFRWPATKADGYYEDAYGGQHPGVKMGSLMAVPPDADLSGITDPDVRKIAEAMQTYGAYVVDDTSGTTTNSLSVQAGAQEELPNIGSDQMRELFAQLDLVDNNTPGTPGGGPLGGPRRAPCAGPFADGTGGAPPGCGAV
ncbi:hypothetical protein ACFPK1_22900 [Actinomycetospora rhizophila]|uniref:Uncharacterized protein n=1 Tax=Actinomycetospora rhizophila TaxID=1416876 RepID=A0ABV9ZLQ3_9PSEU